MPDPIATSQLNPAAPEFYPRGWPWPARANEDQTKVDTGEQEGPETLYTDNASEAVQKNTEVEKVETVNDGEEKNVSTVEEEEDPKQELQVILEVNGKNGENEVKKEQEQEAGTGNGEKRKGEKVENAEMKDEAEEMSVEEDEDDKDPKPFCFGWIKVFRNVFGCMKRKK